MKKLILVLLIKLFIYNASAQVTIGSAAVPQSGSVLDLQSGGDKALLLPRVADTSSIATPSFGMFIYTTNSNKIYFHDGSRWVEVVNNNTAWVLNGNTGTNPAINFIGTADANDLVVKTNNVENLRVLATPDATNTIFYTKNGDANINGITLGRGKYNSITNTAVGWRTLFSNVSGSLNVAIGAEALYSNTSGGFNTAIGGVALYSNTTGSNNAATGEQALYSNTTGNNNTATGVYTLDKNTTGSFNTATGVAALFSNTTGRLNTATGYESLYFNISGEGNTAAGYRSLYSTTLGNFNVASGYWALNLNTTGSYNTAIGTQALLQNTVGSFNTAVGFQALSNTTGNYNTALGYQAGSTITTGLNNTVLGYAANVADPTASNQLNIANNIFGTGLTGSVSAPAGNIGIGTSAPASVLDVNGSFGKAITVLSASASLILNATHSTVIIKSGVTATITLPAPASCARRTYTIINHNLLGGGSISNYINLLGANSTSLPLIGPITVQSDGNDWYQIQ